MSNAMITCVANNTVQLFTKLEIVISTQISSDAQFLNTLSPTLYSSGFITIVYLGITLRYVEPVMSAVRLLHRFGSVQPKS